MSFDLYESLNELRLQNIGCDVIFEIGDQKFPAHRAVLMARIKYFRNILTEETNKSIVPLESKTINFSNGKVFIQSEAIDSTYFSDVLNYVYTSQINLSNENIQAIYRIADGFRFDELMDKIQEHMRSNIKLENVFFFKTIARELGLESLEDVFTQFICQQFMYNIDESRKILIPTLSLEQLKEIFEITKETEKFEEMFYFAVEWILGGEVNRTGMLLELLKMIPLESLRSNFLRHVLSQYKLIREDKECLKLLIDSFIKASKCEAKEERRRRIGTIYAIRRLDRANLLVPDTPESLNELRSQNIGCYGFLDIGRRRFPAHRVVLIARMEYFRNILTLHTENGNESVIPLDPEIIDSTFFDEILNYIYTLKITFTTENIQPIYKAAEYFHFDEFIYELKKHMKFKKDMDNNCSYLPIAIELGAKSLQGIFAQFIFKQIFSDINRLSREKLIPTLLFEDLEELLQELKENGRIEDMFHYSYDWINQNELERSKQLLELLKNIPLEMLSLEFLNEVVSQNNLIRNNINCLNFLLDALIILPVFHNYSYSLYAIGGTDKKELSSVSEYNSATREWTAITPMPSERTHFGCAVVGHEIYICGGSGKQHNMNEFTVFDTVTRRWTQLTPMKHARQLCGMAVLDQQIYVAGGWNGTDQLAVVERYNVHTGQWKDVTPMTTKRSQLELVALKGFLYAIGGDDGREALETVERYDPQADQWILMANMNYGYGTFSSAVLNDNIYIAGDNKCEVYNTALKRWIEMPAPSECEAGRRLAVLNGKIYAIGRVVREVEDLKDIKTVEVYDFQERVWKPEPDMDMDVARRYHRLVVVTN